MGQTHHGQTVKHEPWLLRTMRNHCSKFERRSLHSLQCLTSHTYQILQTASRMTQGHKQIMTKCPTQQSSAFSHEPNPLSLPVVSVRPRISHNQDTIFCINDIQSQNSWNASDCICVYLHSASVSFHPFHSVRMMHEKTLIHMALCKGREATTEYI